MLSEGAESCGLVRMMMRLVMSEESSRMTGDVEMGMEGDPSTMTASADIDWEGEALVELGQALKLCYIIALVTSHFTVYYCPLSVGPTYLPIQQYSGCLVHDINLHHRERWLA